MINKLTPYLILVALMVSACAVNSPMSTEPPLTALDEPVENVRPPSAASSASEQIESGIPAEIQPEASPAIGISFANDVLPILQSRCIVCHGEERREQGLDLTSYSALIAGSYNGSVFIASDADSSLIIELVLAGRMPKLAPRLIPTQVQSLIEWINQGALDN